MNQAIGGCGELWKHYWKKLSNLEKWFEENIEISALHVEFICKRTHIISINFIHLWVVCCGVCECQISRTWNRCAFMHFQRDGLIQRTDSDTIVIFRIRPSIRYLIGRKRYIRHLRLNCRKLHAMNVQNINHVSKSSIHVKWVIMCLCDSECVSSSHSKSYQWVYDNASPPKNHNCVCVLIVIQ